MVHLLGGLATPFLCKPINASSSKHNYTTASAFDSLYIKRAAELADKSSGFTAPHPNFGCVIAVPNGGGTVLGEGYLYAEGTVLAEVQAVEAAGEQCRGATAYLNMEPGDCHCDNSAVSALIKAGITRVVVGIRHPLQHLRGNAIHALRSEGLQVDVLGEDIQNKTIEDAIKSCLFVNAPLLYRAACQVPFSVLKYAMTLDGKISASSGHASWISSKKSRTRVFEMRGRSDAVIVGGNTVRRDNPRLTVRHGGDHLPRRIVLSQTLDLPEEAHLWNVSEVPTLVATQRGARRSFQRLLASKGVEVVEFDILDPRDVMEYLYDRGYLSILWECGGTLAASAISSGVIHKIGPDILVSGFLQPVPDLTPTIPSVQETSAIDPSISPYESSIIFFYKTWDPYGAFSNFSLHPIQMSDENEELVTWSSVEHYYQAQKFVGVSDPVAKSCIEELKCAKSPEEAARIGRRIQRQQPNLVRPDWESIKIDVMYNALKCKFTTYPYLNSLLLSTAGSVLVEGSPHDLFWGGGRDGEGLNYLGRLLMKLRSDLLGDSSTSQKSLNPQTYENK